MADKIVDTGNGQTINLGDPDNCDARYAEGAHSIWFDAKQELDKFPQLVLADIKTRGGPQTQLYLTTLEEYAASKKVYGRWPVLPARVED